jgi:hypothetical protein
LALAKPDGFFAVAEASMPPPLAFRSIYSGSDSDMKLSNGLPGGLLAAASMALVLAGCGGSANDDLPLIRATISVKTVSMGGVCETVPIRITPVELSGPANKYANDKMIVAEIETTGPTDENGAPMCNGTGQSLPLAPGKWEFSAPLRSDTYKCVKDIRADGDLTVDFADGYEGCDGATVAEEEAPEPTTGVPGADEAPAAGTAPAEAGAADKPEGK